MIYRQNKQTNKNMYNITVWNALHLIQIEGQVIWLFCPRTDMGHVECDTGDMGFSL